jgi:hypothetical protein
MGQPRPRWRISQQANAPVGLSPASPLAARRGFNMGDFTRVHSDKWMTNAGGLREIEHLGLAINESPQSAWILIEATTAAEFMAALALSLCEAAGARGWRLSDRDSELFSS